MENDIRLTRFFEHSPQDVWDALTQPEHLEKWLMTSDFQPIVGYKFRFTHAPKNDSNYEGLIEGMVIEAVPPTRLSYSWKGRTKDGRRTFDSIVTWILIPKEMGTELQLQHDGFTLAEDVAAHSKGWDLCLQRMEKLLHEKQ